MSDKFRRTHPLKISFSASEQPSYQKLTALSTQSRSGAALLEKALGDLWNQAGDSILNSFPLQIPNIARQMGQTVKMNPLLVHVTDDFRYYERAGERWENQSEGVLLFKPKSSEANAGWVSGTGIFANAPEANETDVLTSSDWWLDNDTGRFVCGRALTTSDTITYTVGPDADWIGDENVIPSVIPDPAQAAFTSCRISEDGGDYFIHLPPRQPLSLSAREEPEKYFIASEETASGNVQDTEDVTPYKLWSSATVALGGTGDAFYRYQLAKEIDDALTGLSEGEKISEGTLILWDGNDETIVEDAVFRKAPAVKGKWVLQVESDTLDLSNFVTTTEDEASYSNTDLHVITCGAPITRSIRALWSRLFDHDHSGRNEMDNQITHRDLTLLNPPDNNYTIGGHDTNYPADLPVWASSRWQGDDHVSLLSRGGSFGGAHANRRDPLDNAMLGHLVLANSDAADYLNAACPDQSFRLYFGAVNGPSVYGHNNGLFVTASAAIELAGSGVSLAAGVNTPISLYTYGSGDIVLDSEDEVNISADDQITIGAINNTYLSANTLINIASQNNVSLSAAGSGSGNLSLTANAGGAIVITSDHLRADGTGNFTMGPQGGTPLNNTILYLNAAGEASGYRALSALASDLGSGHDLQITLGQSETTGNTGMFSFKYVGDNNTENVLELGVWPNKYLSIYNTGNVALNTGDFVPLTATQDLGAVALPWDNLYVNAIDAGPIDMGPSTATGGGTSWGLTCVGDTTYAPLRISALTSEPTNTYTGQIYSRSTGGQLWYRNISEWERVVTAPKTMLMRLSPFHIVPGDATSVVTADPTTSSTSIGPNDKGVLPLPIPGTGQGQSIDSIEFWIYQGSGSGNCSFKLYRRVWNDNSTSSASQVGTTLTFSGSDAADDGAITLTGHYPVSTYRYFIEIDNAHSAAVTIYGIQLTMSGDSMTPSWGQDISLW